MMTPSPTSALARTPQKTALIVASGSEIDELLVTVLTTEGWNIQHTVDNQDVLSIARTNPFDLIITGRKTSGPEDLELLRKIRSARPHLRLIILTDEWTPGDIIAAMRAGALSYFVAPFQASALAEMVRAAMAAPCWDDGIEVLSATPNWIRLVARCDLKTAERLMQFMHELTDLPEPESDAVATAFREILMNAIEHGGHFRADQYVEISYVRAKHMVMCRVKDPGEGFTLDEIDHAAVANPEGDPARHIAYREAKGLRPGGYGVLLAQKLVDELIYDQKGNEVMLVKYLDVAPLENV